MNGATPEHVSSGRLFDGSHAWDLSPDESQPTTASRGTVEGIGVGLITHIGCDCRKFARRDQA